MNERFQQFDWTGTPLGPVDAWPRALQSAVSIAFGCAFPVVVRWGSDLIQIYNDAYIELMGAQHPRGFGRPMREVWPEGWEAMQAWITRVFAGETVYFEDTVFPVVRHDVNEDAYFTVSYGPLLDDDGKVGGIFTVAMETTQRIKAEARMRRARVEAEEANRAKADFLATMSHELRTPLNAIGGYVELIELGVHGPLTDDQRNALGRIQTSQRHLLSLINQILSYSRLEAGAVEYRIEDFDIAESLAVCEALCAPQLREKQIHLNNHVQVSKYIAHADRDKLEQITLNLLSNAIKFTEPGGAIEVSATSNGDVVCISVADTGPGIAGDQLEEIFDPFVQVDSGLTRSCEGVGLGLATSRDLARGMHGDVTVSSELGAGTTFRIAVPQA